MSKQKKTKQPPVLGRLLAYAGGHKWLSVLGCGLSGVSAAVGIFPFVFVWYAARGILTPGGGVPAGLARYGWYALAAALLSAAIYFAGFMCTHLDRLGDDDRVIILPDSLSDELFGYSAYFLRTCVSGFNFSVPDEGRHLISQDGLSLIGNSVKLIYTCHLAFPPILLIILTQSQGRG